MDDDAHLEAAIRLAVEAAASGGGPFGAVVVDSTGATVGAGTNGVVATTDPTAHAEVVALRAAARTFGRPDLFGCVLYASCYPCPMCLAASWWARVDRVVYAATAADAAAVGFDDERFWHAVRTGTSIVPLEHVPVPSATEPFATWTANPNRVPY